MASTKATPSSAPAAAAAATATARRTGQFEVLALMFLVIIGSSWILRPVKEGIFYITVGLEHIPLARMLSFVVMIPIMMVYSKLVDWCARERLLYVVCSVYGAVFSLVGLVMHCIPTGSSAAAAAAASSSNLDTLILQSIGWVTFFAVESCASISAAMFWSFVQLTVRGTEASDKKGYVLITAAAQIGSIGGSQLATSVEHFGIPSLTAFGGLLLFGVVGITYIYARCFIHTNERTRNNNNAATTEHEPSSKQRRSGGDDDKAAQTGALAGLQLVFSDWYLVGIFIVCSISEVVSIVVDFQMKMLAKDQFPAGDQFAAYMARFGVWSNCASLAVSLLLWLTGFVERMSLTTIVLAFPLLMSVVLSWCWIEPNLEAMFFALVAMKGLGYGLNNPAKQLLYRPVARHTITRVKGWIDVFGGTHACAPTHRPEFLTHSLPHSLTISIGRGAKAAGSVLTSLISGSIERLLNYGMAINLALVGVWVAFAVGVVQAYSHRLALQQMQAETISSGVDGVSTSNLSKSSPHTK